MTLNEWIIFGRVGTSSRTMWAAITDTVKSGHMRAGGLDIPYDPDDFSRCYKLWEECAITQEQLLKVKAAFPWWGPYIDHWGELVERYENKDAGLCEFMHTLRAEAEKIGLTPWKELAPGVSIAVQ